MKTGNRGQTSLRLKPRTGDSMRDYDRLPAELRAWVAAAILPWRPRSVRIAFECALARTRDKARALEELDRIQDRLMARDARSIWGADHPDATSGRGLEIRTPPASAARAVPPNGGGTRPSARDRVRPKGQGRSILAPDAVSTGDLRPGA